MQIYESMGRERLEEILDRICGIRAGIFGDVCLDVYWRADMRKSELSRETPHYPLPVVEERMSPGGGGNVAVNMKALCPQNVRLFSIIGCDWRGRELLRLFGEHGVDISAIGLDESCVTNAYIKPIRQGVSDVAYEDPRLDFTSYKPASSEMEDSLITALDKAASGLDLLCVSDQMPFGIVTKRVRDHLRELARQGLCVVADSRSRIGLFTDMILKPNELEGAMATGLDPAMLRGVQDFTLAARNLAEGNNSGVFMTLGSQGSLYVDEQMIWHIPAHKLSGAIDICGAGDSSLSGFGLSLAAGAEPWEAAYIAGLCSEVAIQQVGATGTASREQVLGWHSSLETRV